MNSVRVSGLASQPAEHAPCSLCFINRDARLASLIATLRPQSVTQCVARSLVSPSCFLAFFARSRYGVHGDISSPMAGAAAAASATRTLALLACWCGDDREVVDEKERCQDRALEHIGKVESRNHASGKITNGRKKKERQNHERQKPERPTAQCHAHAKSCIRHGKIGPNRARTLLLQSHATAH